MGCIPTTVLIATCLVWFTGVTGVTYSQITQDSGVCGDTKGCFSVPEGCSPDVADSCQAFSSWSLTADNTSLFINLWCETTTYIALGFSKSGHMGNSDVYACTSEKEVVRSRNKETGDINIRQTLTGVTNQTVVFENGVVRCSFVRVLKKDDDDDETFYDLTCPNKYTPILAWNGTVKNGVLSEHHDEGYSDEAVHFDACGSDHSTKSTGIVILFLLLCSSLVVYIY